MIGVTAGPSTMPPLLARSAMVSASLIFQSAIRLSTISSAATAPLTAAATSSAVQSGPRRSSRSTRAISASTRGAMKSAARSTAPSGFRCDDSTGAKSGESTPSICCIGALVSPSL